MGSIGTGTGAGGGTFCPCLNISANEGPELALFMPCS